MKNVPHIAMCHHGSHKAGFAQENKVWNVSRDVSLVYPGGMVGCMSP